MAANAIEGEVISKLSKLNLVWEKIGDKEVWRAETQNFTIVLDFTSSETYYIYFKRKGDEAVKRISSSSYGEGNWSILRALRDKIKEDQQKRTDLWLDEFLKEESSKPKTDQVSENHLPEDGLENTRSE